MIKNLREANKMGNTYLLTEDNTNYEVRVYKNYMEIQDYTNNVFYCLNTSHLININELYKIVSDIKEWKTVKEFVEIIKSFKYFSTYENKEKYNPFYKKLTGTLKIKLKNGIFITKPNLKKILQHSDTKVITKYYYTDDYSYDNHVNFGEGREVFKESILKDVCESNVFSGSYDGSEINVYNSWSSYKIENPNVIFD